MVFTDPPYNVRIDGHVCGLGKVKHREFAMASGEMSEAEFTRLFEDRSFAIWPGRQRRADPLRRDGLASHGRGHDGSRRRLQRRSRTSASGRRPTAAWDRSTARNTSSFSCSRPGPRPTSTMSSSASTAATARMCGSYAGANASARTAMTTLPMHPTVKPVALVADAILDCSKRKAIVLDAFAGSAPRWLPRTGPAGGATASNSTPTTATSSSAAWPACQARCRSRPDRPGLRRNGCRARKCDRGRNG